MSLFNILDRLLHDSKIPNKDIQMKEINFGENEKREIRYQIYRAEIKRRTNDACKK